MKRLPSPHNARRLDGAAHGVDEAGDDVEPEAEALLAGAARRFLRERLEDPGQDPGVDADSRPQRVAAGVERVVDALGDAGDVDPLAPHPQAPELHPGATGRGLAPGGRGAWG